MEALGKDIWIVEGGTVPFFTLPYSTRILQPRWHFSRNGWPR